MKTMHSSPLPTSVLTFLFTDISGSTRLWERVPAAMAKALARHDEIIRSSVSECGGEIFKTMGDAFCCAFESAPKALDAAIAIQRSLAREPWPPALGTLCVRIGLHTGAAVLEGSDYFGPSLNRVARVMSAGHGGQILLSSASAQAVRDSLDPAIALRDMGAHRLKDLTQPEHLFQVVADGLDANFPALATLDAHPNNLPPQLSVFVGRETELAQVGELLGAHRLVTIAGPGGIGKTRIALQFAAGAIAAYADGAWLVRFADIDDPQLVDQLVASALRLRIGSGQSIAHALADHLALKEALLIFDNAEHVVEAVAQLALRLLEEAPNLKILVTSREPLHMPGEYVMRVGGLIPIEAAQLFVDRARRISSDRSVSKYDPQRILNICTRLEGIPLAIELAAARTATLGAKDLDERIHSGLDVPASKDRSHAPRHRTLAAAIDWSYMLLSAEEQRFFANLAVFEGGFTLEACERVALDSSFTTPALDLLDALVDKSFVSTQVDERSIRFALLEALRDYARAKLCEFDAQGAVAARHFAYFKSLVDRWESWTNQDEQKALVHELDREMPNIRAALADTACAPSNEILRFLQKAGAYWQFRGYITEARGWYTRWLPAVESADSRLAAEVLRRASTFATLDDDYAGARELARRALEIFQDIHDTGGIAESLHSLALIEHYSNNAQRAYELNLGALELFRQTDHRLGMITSLFNLGMLATDLDHLDAAEQFIEQGIQLCSDAAHQDRLASFLNAKGMVLAKRGNFEPAEDLYLQALAIRRDLRSDLEESEALLQLGMLKISQQDARSALQYAREALAAAARVNSPQYAIEALEISALALSRNGRTPEALTVLRATEAERTRIQYAWRVAREFEPELGSLRASIDGSLTEALNQPAFQDVIEALLERPDQSI